MTTWEYHTYMASKEWHDKKQLVKQRDGYECRYCRNMTTLEVHHKSYELLGNEPLEDLLTLCRKCHVNLHQLMKENALEHVRDRPLTDELITNAFAHPLFDNVGEHLKEKFIRYNENNKKVYVLFVYYAGLERKYKTRYPAKSIIERIRNDYDRNTLGRIQINNSLTSLYARILAITNEIYYHFFNFRVSPHKKPTEAQITYKKFMSSRV